GRARRPLAHRTRPCLPGSCCRTGGICTSRLRAYSGGRAGSRGRRTCGEGAPVAPFTGRRGRRRRMLIQIRTPQGQGEGLVGGRLVDRQARTIRYLRVSLTDRCNYRCTYCMPEEGIDHRPRDELLILEEIAAVCRAFAAWGVERVRLTGGEPTVRRGLVDLVGALARIRGRGGEPIAVTMTTNGERLGELARPLARAGLRGITVSLDSLDPGRFAAITRRGALDRVLAGV